MAETLFLDEEGETYGYGVFNVRTNQFITPEGVTTAAPFVEEDEVVEYYQSIMKSKESTNHLRVVEVRLDNALDAKAAGVDLE